MEVKYGSKPTNLPKSYGVAVWEVTYYVVDEAGNALEDEQGNTRLFRLSRQSKHDEGHCSNGVYVEDLEEKAMSYCRWSCPVPELTPDVDVSAKKMLEIYSKGGGFGDWLQYLADNDVVLSDAYVYESEDGFVCHWRGEGNPDWAVTAQEMAEVLIDGVKRGKCVPQSAIQMLLEETTDE